MEAVLRDIRKRSDGTEEYTDSQFSGDEISVGSAPDQAIQILGDDIESRHAIIKFRGSSPVVSCRDGRTISVNGKATRSAKLSPSDVVSIGGHKFRFFQVPRGFDIAISIERNAKVSPKSFEKAFRTDLEQTWMSKRLFSWLLLITVPLLTMAAPLFVLHWKDRNPAVTAFLPSDRIWSSGKVHEAHELASGGDCASCHEKLFVRVRDEACLECHANIENHVRDEQHMITAGMTATPRCANCHREHDEPPHLIVENDKLCSDCHGGNETALASLDLDVVSGFTLAGHPPFEVHLNKPRVQKLGTGISVLWDEIKEPLTTASEDSNLQFTHALHLDPEKITSASNEALVCVDCHTLTREGEHFVPVSMEATCASSSCHDLRFDADMPDRLLPHGKPLEVMLALESLFLRMYSDPEFDAAVRKRRRLPDDKPPSKRCKSQPLACATRDAAGEIEQQFTLQGCVTCHQIEDTESADIYTRFQVHPVRLNEDYFRNAIFPHDNHLVMGELTGDAACQQCHAVSGSETSEDLLLPNVDNCVECHGDDAKERVTVSCVECHGYHPKTPARNDILEVQVQ